MDGARGDSIGCGGEENSSSSVVRGLGLRRTCEGPIVIGEGRGAGRGADAVSAGAKVMQNGGAGG